ncbi:tripartite motif-containing protein 2-like [Mizuhopecten yessoensis]|uniref:tripartite motif-containing protein 2-like n=1 Tax=Mizuhopecten yessoensis TaxID=6573 RepID=UPI000B45B023|nr:tripartite motif-containing protein 2-like [Mizuhopecten yessoensis]
MATPIGQIPLCTCTEHKGRPLELYCEKCDMLVCYKCLISTHKGHNACEISDITPTKKQDIQNFIDRTEKHDLVQLREYITSTDTLLKDNTSNFENLSDKLKKQTDKLKKDLDLLTSQTLSVYHKMEEDNTKLIQKYKQDLEMYDKQLRQQIQECKAALQQGSQIEIYDTGCEIHSQISLPVKPVLGTASFTPNKTPHHHLELALGKIDTLDQGQASTDQDGSVMTSGGQKPSSTSQQSEPKGKKAVTMYKLLPQTKVLEEWESPVDINSICPTTDGQVWTSAGYSNTLTLLDRNGKVIQQVKQKAVINNISLSPTTNTLWVCDRENNIMELVSGRPTHIFSIKEYPICICVTASNHVIEGMTKHISKFTTQGQMVLTTSVTGTGKPLVCSPWRISECPVTHNVAVVDWNNKDNGADGIEHVIVMDSDFKELFIYRGDIPSTYKQSSHKGAKPFNPYGVVYDSVGNIIIGDRDNYRVLLISGRGEFLGIIHTDTYSIWAVGVGREDVLWAVFGGMFGGNVKLLQYTSV